MSKLQRWDVGVVPPTAPSFPARGTPLKNITLPPPKINHQLKLKHATLSYKPGEIYVYLIF